jgi:hypothetical protein
LISPREIFEQQYKAAAAEGAILELRLRLLADKVPELQQYARGQIKLVDVETAVVQHFVSCITEEEETTLELCRQLRNTILHCDFWAARDKLEQVGVATQRANVKKVDICGLSGAQMAAKITDAVANVEGTFEHVADTPSEPGKVFGWLMEAGSAGDFIQAAKVFAHGAAIVDRLALSSQ